MSGFDPNAWQDAKVSDGSGDPPPEPGTYWATVETAEVFTSNAGEDFIRMAYRIRGGPDDGYSWSMLGGSFGSEGAVSAAKTHCARLGIDVAAIGSQEELDQALRECVGRTYEINVKQNGEYRNVYVNSDVTDDIGVSDIPAPDPDPEPAATGTDDDIPF